MYKNLSQNIRIPMVGFGTYLIEDNEAESAVSKAVGIGYRHVDTAEGYGNERGVGAGLKTAMKGSGLSRDDIFITTKLYPGNEDWGQPVKTYEQTINSLNASLSELQLDYVDLYLIHAPFAKTKRLEQWNALVELQRLGKTRAIGVSNFNKNHIEEIKSAGLPLPAVDQIELHPWSQKKQLVSYLAENHITIIAYSSLVPLSGWRQAPGHDSAKTEDMKAEGAYENSPFREMAQKYGVSEAQILLRWGLQKGYCVLPKSTNENRMRQNLDIFSFEIDKYDMQAIEGMDKGTAVAWGSGDPSAVE